MNSFGHHFRITLFGESHGPVIGVILDGVPPGLPLSPDDFTRDLERRKSGPLGTTPRKEEDRPLIRAGLYRGKCTGAPLVILFENRDVNPDDYRSFTDMPRPGHADYTARVKYKDFNDPRGGGMFSGRLTAGLVAAGIVAKKIIAPVKIAARLLKAGGSEDIESAVRTALEAGDSIGGLIECRVDQVPSGLGDPFFDSVESLLAHALFSIPGITGIEFGSGFHSAEMRGSEHNDILTDSEGHTATNNAGGINGGITNGNPLLFRVAVKPTPTIPCAQETVNMATGRMELLRGTGRHDACFALRVPVIVEAMTAVVLADYLLP
jgi:chorismate synthase